MEATTDTGRLRGLQWQKDIQKNRRVLAKRVLEKQSSVPATRVPGGFGKKMTGKLYAIVAGGKPEGGGTGKRVHWTQQRNGSARTSA